jgi:hypothetical protein
MSEVYCKYFTTSNAVTTVADVMTSQRLATVGVLKHIHIHYVTQTYTDLRVFIYSFLFIALTDLFRESG